MKLLEMYMANGKAVTVIFMALSIFLMLVPSMVIGQKCNKGKFVLKEDGICNESPYELVFEDGFDVPELDNSKWLPRYTWHNSDGLALYTLGLNYEFADGILKLIPKKEKNRANRIDYLPETDTLGDGLVNNRQYEFTSGMIFSKNLYGDGVFEIRCKIPSGQDYWPAFWLFGDGGELDIFEFYEHGELFSNYRHRVRMNQHHNGSCPTKHYGPDYSGEFHTFKLVREPYKLEWYVDGTLKRRVWLYYGKFGKGLSCNKQVDGKKVKRNNIYPVGPMHLIVNLSISGENPTLPNTMEIDYIKIYKRKTGS